uniref:Transporter n=1 Tax=Schmidtea mediterranea TaxID=79327 RepID=A0A0H3YIU5_SCHMD|nr:slc6a-6 [Schmidtea mediterranea]
MNKDLTRIVVENEMNSSPIDCKIVNEALKSLALVDNNSRPKELFPEIVKDSSGEEIHITYSKQSTGPDRQTWGGKIEFLCSCVAMAVGLGNVWRFPYLCYKNGGGAFLVPYFSMLFLVGLPLFFMELAFGQFASLGPITVWSISPLFKGIGYGMVIASFILSTYYNVIIAQSLYYLFASFNTVLPWMFCDTTIKNSSCFDSTMDIYNWSLAHPNSTKVSPSEQYFEKNVLNISGSILDLGAPQWKLCLCLLLAWIVVLAVLLKGINSLGKVAYFTAIFPYVILCILLIRGSLLPGAMQGIIFYIKPRFDRIRDSKVWTDAATQIFFSLSCCNGNLITMSSYNNFKNNCCRDAVFVAILNCATSIFAGFVIFTNLGFMAHLKNTTIDNVVDKGPGLAFVVYPEALTHMFMAPLWSICFFLMMITLGFGSQFAIVETVLAGIQDELRRLRLLKSQFHVIIFRVSICILCFLLGIPMTCRGGMYILNMLDYVISGYVLLVLALLEIIVICYFYGINRFRKDIALMTTKRPNWYWRIMWMYISPGVISLLIIFYFVSGDTLKYGDFSYPQSFVTLTHFIALFPLIFVPSVFIYRYCKEGGWIILREVIKPKSEWGPADEENRQVFISSIMRMDEQSNAISGSKEAKMPSPDNMSTPIGDSFFQSKRSLLSKFSEVAAKENSKNPSN